MVWRCAGDAEARVKLWQDLSRAVELRRSISRYWCTDHRAGIVRTAGGAMMVVPNSGRRALRGVTLPAALARCSGPRKAPNNHGRGVIGSGIARATAFRDVPSPPLLCRLPLGLYKHLPRGTRGHARSMPHACVEGPHQCCSRADRGGDVLSRTKRAVMPASDVLRARARHAHLDQLSGERIEDQHDRASETCARRTPVRGDRISASRAIAHKW